MPSSNYSSSDQSISSKSSKSSYTSYGSSFSKKRPPIKITYGGKSYDKDFRTKYTQSDYHIDSGVSWGTNIQQPSSLGDTYEAEELPHLLPTQDQSSASTSKALLDEGFGDIGIDIYSTEAPAEPTCLLDINSFVAGLAKLLATDEVLKPAFEAISELQGGHVVFFGFKLRFLMEETALALVQEAVSPEQVSGGGGVESMTFSLTSRMRHQFCAEEHVASYEADIMHLNNYHWKGDYLDTCFAVRNLVVHQWYDLCGEVVDNIDFVKSSTAWQAFRRRTLERCWIYIHGLWSLEMGTDCEIPEEIRCAQPDQYKVSLRRQTLHWESHKSHIGIIHSSTLELVAFQSSSACSLL